MPQIRFLPQNRVLEVPVGTSLLAAARELGLSLEAPCDGVGSCGKCKAKASPLSALRESSHEWLTQAERAEGWVLACQSAVVGDVEATVETSLSDGLKILNDGQAVAVALDPWVRKAVNPALGVTQVFAGDQVLAIEPGDTVAHVYGLAIDFGTTTLVVALNHLRDGRELAVASSLNPQARYAQDVLSRIRIGSKPEGLQTLQRELIQELNRLIGEVTASAGVATSHIYEAVFSGNTTMLHLAVGTNPASLGKYPYTPALVGATHELAALLGLAISPHGLVYLPPIMAAYVGADITSGILATRLAELPGVTLFVDIGTNGEMVLAVDGQLTATSTAAGPAFEGMNIACGMRAGRGAVERVQFNGEGVAVRTIGEAAPIGICGSGLLDAVGEMAAYRAIDKNGRFQANGASAGRPWASQWETLDGVAVFRLGGPVYLTQKDIRQVQLAKAAIRVGIELMLKANNLGPENVDRVLIAGSFGYHLRAPSLINLGLLPREFAGRVEFVGNTSKTGAQAFLLNRQTRENLRAITQKVRVLELANDAAFEKAFVQALAF
jgi:uncharacterized 2Fe-2S/4Fe-4S cluster protein (DUF4445 family)